MFERFVLGVSFLGLEWVREEVRRVLIPVVDARLAFGVYFGAALQLCGEPRFLGGVGAQRPDRDREGLPAGGGAVLDPAELEDRPRVEDEELEELVAGGALGLLFTADVALAGERQQRGGELV